MVPTSDRPEKQSLWGTVPDPTYRWFGPDDLLVVEQRARGFSSVVDSLLLQPGSSAPEAAHDGSVPPADPNPNHNTDPRALPSESRVVLGAEVQRVSYSCSGARVRTADGMAFRAKFVISTLPVGVLQRRRELFVPALRPEQRRALDGYAMSNYTKVFAQWESPWWDDSLPRWLVGNGALDGGALPSCRNLNHAAALPGSLTLLWDLAEPHASVWEAMNDAQAAATLL